MSSGDRFIADFMDDYFAECDEHIVALRGLLLDLERSLGAPAVDAEILAELFRIFHSVKGISGMVELREAEMLAHDMESYLRALRQQDVALSQAGVDALLAGVAALETVVAARKDERPLPDVSAAMRQVAAVTPALALPGATVGSAPKAASAAADWVVTFTPSTALNARGMNVDAVRARLRELGTILRATPTVLETGIVFVFEFAGTIDAEAREAWIADGIQVAPVAVPAPIQDAGPAASDLRPEPAAQFVRVELGRLDDLMRMIGDLVISRARLDDTLARIEPRVPGVEWRAVHENTMLIERQLRDLREGVVRVRLVPVGEIFRRMPFVVRDLARESGAKVRLTIEGQETEIDKFLIERMMDPVLHLVRNAVSHGFETPAERRAAGKPEEGTLRLSASTAGDAVLIEIADDGRGIDAAEVARRGRAAGLPVPEGALDQATVLELICAPGFSTRDETDRGSGRGVGMAVVKSTIQQLNGTLTLDSEPGNGTRFIVELPLTLSITEAMIATVGERTFAVPQASVREVIEVDPASLRAIERHEITPYRGGALPIVRLGRLFDIPEQPRRALHVFVVGAGLDAVGVAVDRIVGQREIVVRTMADALIKVPGVSGATDLGDGRVVLILNLVALARLARVGRPAARAGSAR